VPKDDLQDVGELDGALGVKINGVEVEAQALHEAEATCEASTGAP